VVVAVVGVHHIVERHILAVEDIQLVVMGTCKVVQLVVDVVVLVPGMVEGIVEVGMALVLEQEQNSGLILAVQECKKVELIFRGSVDPYF